MKSDYYKQYYLANKEKYRLKYQEKKKKDGGQLKKNVEENISVDRTICIATEEDLHLQIIKFMREYYPDIITMSLPIDKIHCNDKMSHISYLIKHGYHKGTPDLMIPEHQIAIELKRPQKSLLTKASEEQNSTLDKLAKANWTCILSNDYTEIIHKLSKLL